MNFNRFSNAFFLSVISGVVIFSGCQKEGYNISQSNESSPSSIKAENGNLYVANEVLVRFKEGQPETVKEKVFQKIQGSLKEKIYTKAMEKWGEKEAVYLLHTPYEAMQAAGILKNIGEIEYAEPNYIYTHNAVSNDPYFTNSYLWNMCGDSSAPSNIYGSQAAEAWMRGNTGSAQVLVGIIDEGFMNTHEDLAENSWVNPFDPVDGIDNDGNGYVDDKNGWDFDGRNNSVFDGLSDDHGTHVAGTIGARGGNGKGVAGVCWNTKMISCKFLGKRGGTTANAIKAIDYITDLKTRHNLNIVATNNSWGGGGYSQSLKDAIDRAGMKDILFVAAAGNDGRNNDVYASYPSGYSSSNIISVASITSGGALSSFSNYGSTNVDIAAPGSSVYSCLPGRNLTSSYGALSGTSMATPHVTGAVALYASTHEGVNAVQIKAAILNSTIGTTSLTGKCVTGGRLNLSDF